MNAYELVSWKEVRRVGAFVFCRRGTGETGWWHHHEGEEDHGGNPCDYNRETKLHVCRTCGSSHQAA